MQMETHSYCRSDSEIAQVTSYSSAFGIAASTTLVLGLKDLWSKDNLFVWCLTAATSEFPAPQWTIAI